jgi:muramidase (phage lysozyme)
MQRYGNDPAKAWAAFEAGPETIDRLVAQRGDDWYGGLGDDTRRFVDGNMRMLGTVRSQHSAPNDIRALSAVALAQTPNAAQSTIMPASVIRLVGTPSSNTGGMDWEPSLRGGPDVQESGADNFAADGVTPKRRTAPGTAGNQRNGAQQQIPIIADDVLKGISAGSASPDRQASNRAQAEADLDNPVVVTLLQMIAYYEGPDRANGYAQIQGKLKPTDPKITDFTRYPDIGDIAAGRYQIERKNMYTTGVRNLGITSFNPNDQDMMAAFVLRHYGIIDKIEAGDFAGAMPKLANFWRALPLPGVASGVSGDARGNFTTFVKIFKELYPLVQADMNRRVLDRGQFRYVGEALRTVSPDFGAIDDSMNKNSNYVSILDKYHIFK